MKSKSKSIAETPTVDYLTQLTLNTRTVDVIPVQNVHRVFAVEAMPIVAAGVRPIPALPGFHVELKRGRNSLQFSIERKEGKILAGALLWGTEDEALAWSWLSEILAHHASVIPGWGPITAPHKPATLPWAGVVLLPMISILTSDELSKVCRFVVYLTLAVLFTEHSRN